MTNIIVTGIRNAGGKLTSNYRPQRVVDFNGLTNAQSVVATANDPGSTSGKRWDSVQGNQGFKAGYGMQGDTSFKMTGATSSCKLTIKQGSDGDPAGGSTGTPYGAFGGEVNFTPVPQGGRAHICFWLYLESGFSWANTSFFNKFIRFYDDSGTGAVDSYMANGGYDGSASSATQIGFSLTAEISAGADALAQSSTVRKTDKIVQKGQWVFCEAMTMAHSSGVSAERRLWVDDVLVYERIGVNQKYRNTSGSYVTETLPHGQRTLNSASNFLNRFKIFTYWNDNSPRDNTCWIQSIAAETRPAFLPVVDAFGNPMMGSACMNYLRA